MTRAIEAVLECTLPGAGIAGDTARWIVLQTVFEGDADAWVDYLLLRGSRRQVEEDLPFAIRMAMRERNETGLQ